ncbi:hypothetical protein K491DRAFT_148456 [Lophiostoma macrostomum CBS 122681]|uniref:Uncharacterized protein n=1 Tax=Lophiostoma macrostomum CBS 122681 TaxID=1314788 RepID=A0A6A6SRH6_9PLEO|nr:hypothetical protein K491DRAFT_148456 [Lophiostoma macrostomum CBS 122681]
MAAGLIRSLPVHTQRHSRACQDQGVPSDFTACGLSMSPSRPHNSPFYETILCHPPLFSLLRCKDWRLIGYATPSVGLVIYHCERMKAASITYREEDHPTGGSAVQPLRSTVCRHHKFRRSSQHVSSLVFSNRTSCWSASSSHSIPSTGQDGAQPGPCRDVRLTPIEPYSRRNCFLVKNTQHLRTACTQKALSGSVVPYNDIDSVYNDVRLRYLEYA